MNRGIAPEVQFKEIDAIPHTTNWSLCSAIAKHVDHPPSLKTAAQNPTAQNPSKATWRSSISGPIRDPRNQKPLLNARHSAAYTHPRRKPRDHPCFVVRANTPSRRKRDIQTRSHGGMTPRTGALPRNCSVASKFDSDP